MKTTIKDSRNKIQAKKQVNIAWNSRFFFQIGIIVSSLLVFILMQTSFETRTPVYADNTGFILEEPPIRNYELEIEKPKPVVAVNKTPVKPTKVRKPVISDEYIVKDNSSTEIETPVPSTDLPVVEAPVQQATPPSDPAPSTPTNILNVEFVPVYPGCESQGTNAEKIECLSSKINVFITRNFRKELLEGMGGNEIQKVYVQFKIDSQGFITDVRANSSVPKLKEEAMRVVEKLPRMRPGRQGNKTVDVIYTVPIVLRIQ